MARHNVVGAGLVPARPEPPVEEGGHKGRPYGPEMRWHE